MHLQRGDMTESTSVSYDEMLAEMTQSEAVQAAPYRDEEFRSARGGATPQAMYVSQVKRCPVSDHGDGMYSLWNKEDILFITRHKMVEQGSKYLGSTEKAIPLGLDGPLHTKYRRLIDPIFTAKKMAPLASRVREFANDIIDSFIDDGAADVYHQWCEPLPSTVFLTIMGLPFEDLDDFIRFKNLTLGNEGADRVDKTEEQRNAERLEAVQWLQDYFNRDLDAREAEEGNRPDLIGGLLESEIDGERLTRSDMLSILALFMIAGLDTVAAGLSCNLSHLARHPEHRQQLLDNPDLMPSAVEELMRFEAPVSDGTRIALEELVLPSGTTIPEGGLMHVSWASANLDPAAYDDPLEIDLGRMPNPHIGFASGYHRCLGSHLARMELQTALAVWHERIPHYEIAPGTELRYSSNPRAPLSLPLVWG